MSLLPVLIAFDVSLGTLFVYIGLVVCDRGFRLCGRFRKRFPDFAFGLILLIGLYDTRILPAALGLFPGFLFSSSDLLLVLGNAVASRSEERR